MSKGKKENKVQPKNLEEKKTGYGDKKLEGPDRPAE
ncbi:Spore protein [Mesobacillus zeae]